MLTLLGEKETILNLSASTLTLLADLQAPMIAGHQLLLKLSWRPPRLDNSKKISFRTKLDAALQNGAR